MDRDFFSYTAHASHDFCNPMGEATAAAILDQLDRESAARCLDVGAGKGELLLRILERWGGAGVAVERSPRFAAELRRRAAGRVTQGGEIREAGFGTRRVGRGEGGGKGAGEGDPRPHPVRLTVHERDAAEVLDPLTGARTGAPTEAAPGRPGHPPDLRFTLGICLGSSHALGGMVPTLERLRGITVPGGQILLGEGYWKRPPDPGYLEALGASPEDLLTHEGNLAAAAALGFRPRWSRTASDEEWERYETRYAENVVAFLRENPDHPDGDAMRTRITSWQEAVRRWGLSTLGFGFYLWETPGERP